MPLSGRMRRAGDNRSLASEVLGQRRRNPIARVDAQPVREATGLTFVAEAAEMCDARSISNLGYGLCTYGKWQSISLRKFKICSGTKEILGPAHILLLALLGKALRSGGTTSRNDRQFASVVEFGRARGANIAAEDFSEAGVVPWQGGRIAIGRRCFHPLPLAPFLFQCICEAAMRRSRSCGIQLARGA